MAEQNRKRPHFWNLTQKMPNLSTVLQTIKTHIFIYMKAMDSYIRTAKDIEHMFSVIAVYDNSKIAELDKASKQVGNSWDDADDELGNFASSMEVVNNKM